VRGDHDATVAPSRLPEFFQEIQDATCPPGTMIWPTAC
jgi:hypothetical protein